MLAGKARLLLCNHSVLYKNLKAVGTGSRHALLLHAAFPSHHSLPPPLPPSPLLTSQKSPEEKKAKCQFAALQAILSWNNTVPKEPFLKKFLLLWKRLPFFSPTPFTAGLRILLSALPFWWWRGKGAPFVSHYVILCCSAASWFKKKKKTLTGEVFPWCFPLGWSWSMGSQGDLTSLERRCHYGRLNACRCPLDISLQL